MHAMRPDSSGENCQHSPKGTQGKRRVFDSNLAKPAGTNNHKIDFNNGKIIDKRNCTSVEEHSNHGMCCICDSDNSVQNVYRNNAVFY